MSYSLPAGGDFFDVNINHPRGSVLVRVSPSWNVAMVKDEVAKRTGIAAEDFKIVFAGNALDDELRLNDVGLQSYSTLHYIRSPRRASGVPRAAGGVMAAAGRGIGPVEIVAKDMGRVALDRVASNLGAMSTTTADTEAKQRFFVYCKRPCAKMTPGKLRVRCADCKSSSFELTQGPNGWEDVLESRKMHGNCHNERCKKNDAEFYFKCAMHPTGDNEDSVALHMVRANTIGVECAACTDKRERVLVFNCEDGHSLCVECFIIYCRHQLSNRQFIQDPGGKGYTIRCPNGCTGSEVTEIHHFRLMGMNEDGQDLYAKYQKFATEECILQIGGILCPNRGCGEGLLPEHNGRRIQCPQPNGCGFVFCRECKRSYHDGRCEFRAPVAEQGGQAYQVDPHNMERARWIEANERFIQTNSNIKPCPRCQVHIEKNGGCMHMTCIRANCKYEWCWICGIEWNRNCQSAHWFG